MRGFSLLTKFAMITAILFITLGVSVRHTIHSFIEERTFATAAERAEFIARMSIDPTPGPSTIAYGLSDKIAEDIASAMKDNSTSESVQSVTVWTRALETVYSDDPSLQGTTASPTTAFDAALSGTPSSMVQKRGDGDEILTVYLPLNMDADVAPEGVMGMDMDAGPLTGAVNAETQRLYLILLGALGLLYIVLIRLVSAASKKLQRQATENEYQALHDSLTGLPNRILFRDRVSQALLASQRDKSMGGVMLMDLDRFKDVNDTLGHHAGDYLLKQAARRLQGALRTSDTVARLGGDEFAVLLHGLTSTGDAVAVADKIRTALRQPFLLEGLKVEIDASIGLAFFPNHGHDVDTLMKRADVAMYNAKASGGGYEIYEADRDEYSPTRLSLVAELRAAIENSDLVLHYQPKIDMATEQVIGVEALVRWKHPVRGVIPPEDFISIAEHTGLIEPLTLFVLEECVKTCYNWQQDGLSLTVAANLSARNLQDPELPNKIWAILAKWGVPPSRLEVEITESTIMIDGGQATEVLRRLNAMGVKVAIDDFGTGHSSLSNLKRLPVDILKIDKSFVRHMADNEDDLVIVKSTIDLAHNLGLQVVAEGVENEEIWNHLAALGCDSAQGFHRGRPMQPQEVPWMVGLLQVPSAL
jgi:diguanylate cyclase (GGDEF)-like protein